MHTVHCKHVSCLKVVNFLSLLFNLINCTWNQFWLSIIVLYLWKILKCWLMQWDKDFLIKISKLLSHWRGEVKTNNHTNKNPYNKFPSGWSCSLGSFSIFLLAFFLLSVISYYTNKTKLHIHLLLKPFRLKFLHLDNSRHGVRVVVNYRCSGIKFVD